MDINEVVATLSRLLDSLYDSRDCLNEALRQLVDLQLKNMLTSLIFQRSLMIEVLSREVRKLSSEQALDYCVLRETAPLTYLDLNTLFNAANFSIMIAEIKRGEQGILSKYQAALNNDLPNDIKSLLRQHLSELKENFEKLDTVMILNV